MTTIFLLPKDSDSERNSDKAPGIATSKTGCHHIVQDAFHTQVTFQSLVQSQKQAQV